MSGSDSKMKKIRATKTASVIIKDTPRTRQRRPVVKKNLVNLFKNKNPSVKKGKCSCGNNRCSSGKIPKSRAAAGDAFRRKLEKKAARLLKGKENPFSDFIDPQRQREMCTTSCCNKSPCVCDMSQFAKLKDIFTPCRVETEEQTQEREQWENLTQTSSTLSEPTPSTSSAPDGPRKKKKEYIIHPKTMKYFMNAYKQSPQYADLKAKRFNTSCNSRGIRKIGLLHGSFELFTPEEEAELDRIRDEHLPEVKCQIRGVPGEKYKDSFANFPQETTKDLFKGKEFKYKKREMKKLIGYKGVPFEDKYLRINYPESFITNTCSLDIDMKGQQSIVLPKEYLEKLEREEKERNERRSAGYKGKSITSTVTSPDAHTSGKEASTSSSSSATEKKNDSILLSLLSAPPKKRGKSNQSKSSDAVSCKKARIQKKNLSKSSDAVSSKKARIQKKNCKKPRVSTQSAVNGKNQMYLDKYKHLLGNQTLRVVLNRLPASVIRSYTRNIEAKFSSKKRSK